MLFSVHSLLWVSPVLPSPFFFDPAGAAHSNNPAPFTADAQTYPPKIASYQSMGWDSFDTIFFCTFKSNIQLYIMFKSKLGIISFLASQLVTNPSLRPFHSLPLPVSPILSHFHPAAPLLLSGLWVHFIYGGPQLCCTYAPKSPPPFCASSFLTLPKV